MSEQLVDLREIVQGLHDYKVDYVLFGSTAIVMRLQTLIELKLRRSSPQDLADIEAIEQLERLEE